MQQGRENSEEEDDDSRSESDGSTAEDDSNAEQKNRKAKIRPFCRTLTSRDMIPDEIAIRNSIRSDKKFSANHTRVSFEKYPQYEFDDTHPPLHHQYFSYYSPLPFIPRPRYKKLRILELVDDVPDTSNCFLNGGNLSEDRSPDLPLSIYSLQNLARHIPPPFDSTEEIREALSAFKYPTTDTANEPASFSTLTDMFTAVIKSRLFTLECQRFNLFPLTCEQTDFLQHCLLTESTNEVVV